MKAREKILREQIKELEKLIELKDKRIKELETINIVKLLQQPSVPQIPLSIECQHEYPFPWFGITPPSCKKCGLQVLPYQITCDSGATITTKYPKVG